MGSDKRKIVLSYQGTIFFIGIDILVDTYLRFLERGRELIAAQVVSIVVIIKLLFVIHSATRCFALADILRHLHML
jgi:hypothetical protein